MQSSTGIFKHLTTNFILNAKAPLQKELGMTLDYKPTGIRTMEKYIEKHFPDNQALDYETLMAMGVYYGHIFEKNFKGATWDINVDVVYNLRITIPNGGGNIDVYPFLKMMEFAYDKDRSLVNYYKEIADLMELLR